MRKEPTFLESTAEVAAADSEDEELSEREDEEEEDEGEDLVVEAGLHHTRSRFILISMDSILGDWVHIKISMDSLG